MKQRHLTFWKMGLKMMKDSDVLSDSQTKTIGHQLFVQITQIYLLCYTNE